MPDPKRALVAAPSWYPLPEPLPAKVVTVAVAISIFRMPHSPLLCILVT